MRKMLFAFIILLLLAAALGAQAEIYHFNGFYMTLDVPDTVYTVQLTPASLADNDAAAAVFGETAETLGKRFADEGIVLMARDEKNGRTLIITAQQDDLGKTLYDINEQTADTRASYRVNHSNGTYFGAQGYKFESCEWKNFGDTQGRFLMLKYTQKIDGKVKYRGLWRRTVRNGYSITLDLRVEGRQVSAQDITALNKLQETISFMQVSSAPDAPLTLGFSAPPPEFTNDASFQIKGVTRPGASVMAAFASLKGSSRLYTTTADGKGAFSISVTLPSADYYNMLVTAVINEGMEMEESVSEEFYVEYAPDIIPVTFTSPFPEVFTADSFKLSGTTLTGVTVQMTINSQKTSTQKTGNHRTFSFNVDTSKEGTYDIQLTFAKKEYQTKVLHFTIERTMTPEERKASIRSASSSPEYAKLSKSPATYSGRTLRYNGYITDVREGAGEWIATFATRKNGDSYSQLITVLSAEPVSARPDVRVTLYGTADGTYQMLDADGKEHAYPKVVLAFFDEINP